MNNNNQNYHLSNVKTHIKRIAPIHSQLIGNAISNLPNYIAFNFGQAQKGKEILELEGVLLCPQRVITNPNLKNAHKQSVDWAVAQGLVDNKSIPKINKMRFAAVTATSLSNNILTDLEIVADFTTFFAILDDIWDNQWTQLNNDIKMLWTILTLFLDILRGNYHDVESLPVLDFPKYKNFCSALLDIRSRLDKKDICLADFITSVEIYFRGYILGFINRQGYQVHSESSYFNIRKFTLGAQTAFELCLALQNIKISPETRKHPVFYMILVNGVNALAYLNDIISVSKELSENKPENIILLKYQRLKRNNELFKTKQLLQLAFNDVIHHYNEVMLDLVQLRDWLDYIDNKALPALHVYYQIVTNEIRDNLDYYLTHATAQERYHLLDIKYQEISFDEMTKLLQRNGF